MDDPFANPLVFFPLAVVGFALWFCFISLVIAHVGAWARLARVYRAWNPYEGRVWRFQSAKVGLTDYGSCLTVGADARGLYLAVMLIFRLGHPPMLIPWADITASETQVLFFRFVELRFRQVPGAKIRIRPRLAEKLREGAGPLFPALAGPV